MRGIFRSRSIHHTKGQLHGVSLLYSSSAYLYLRYDARVRKDIHNCFFCNVWSIVGFLDIASANSMIYILSFMAEETMMKTYKETFVVGNSTACYLKISFAITFQWHYNNVVMSEMVTQITSVSIAWSTISSGAHQRKHQSYASLAFVRGIHRWPANSPHKRPVTRKMFPLDDVIMDGQAWFSNTFKCFVHRTGTCRIAHFDVCTVCVKRLSHWLNQCMLIVTSDTRKHAQCIFGRNANMLCNNTHLQISPSNFGHFISAPMCQI